MRLLKRILLLYFLFLLYRQDLYAQTVYYKHFTVNDGLAGNHVYMSHQDLDGYIWIATTSGLSRFDGKRFQKYDYENGLPDNEVLFVTNDNANRIWINSFSAVNSLSVLERKAPVKRFSLSVPSLSEAYYSIRNKTTYLTGFHSLIIIRKTTPPKLISTLFNSIGIIETEDGNCYLNDGRKLWIVEDTILRFVQELNLSASCSRMCYYNRKLYVVSENAIHTYTYKDQRFHYTGGRYFDKQINQIHANSYGVWVVCKDQKGVTLFTSDDEWQLKCAFPIPGFINHIAEDREGGVWLSSSDNGLFYMPDPQFINYTSVDGLASSVVCALQPVKDKKIWLGYNTGTLELVDYKKTRLRIARKMSVERGSSGSGFVLDIVDAGKYGVFALSRNNLLQLSNSYARLRAPGVNKSMALMEDTILGIGGWNYYLCNLKTKSKTEYPVHRVYAQCTDRYGNYWLGGMDGLYKISARQHNQVKCKSFEGYKINALTSVGAYIWIGTQNNGLYLFRDSIAVAYLNCKDEPGIMSNTIKVLAAQGDTLYVGTNKGVVIIVYDYSRLKIKGMRTINHNDGLLSPEVNDLKLVEDSIFIATYGGFSIYRSAIANARPLRYTVSDVFITDLQSNNTADTSGASIPYSSRGVEISFNTAALRYADEVKYLYRLIGFDSKWKSTSGNSAVYTNLPPGSYEFFVAAIDNRGNRSDAHILTFSIMPLFWQTTLFKALLIIILLLLILFFFLLYHRYTQKNIQEKIMHDRIVAKAKLEALRAQIKPHFVFNSMNAIGDYLYNNRNEDAAELLQSFAGLIRKGLNIAAKDFTTIAEETAFLVKYLQLEQKKCDYCFDFRFEGSTNIGDFVIPSLLSQPFVENAVVHGIRNIKGRRAELSVTYELRDKDLICTITDNGVGINTSLRQKRSDSLGTALSKDRINYFRSGMGIDIRLDIADLSEIDAARTGTRVVITILDILQLQTDENYAENTDSRR